MVPAAFCLCSNGNVRFLLTIALVASLAAGQTTPPAAHKPAPKPGASKAQAAPDPDEGSVENGVYTSDFFHFTYTLPDGFEVDEEFLQDVEDASKSTWVLLAAQGPLSGEDRRDAVVLMADKEATTADAYVQKVQHDYADQQGFEVIKPAYVVTIAGKPFSRADFRKEGTYQTAVFTILNGYAVGFSLAAPNAEAMNVLLESLNSLKFQNASTRASTSNAPAASSSKHSPGTPKKPSPAPKTP